MRLRYKISIACAIVLVCAIGISGLVVIVDARNSMIEVARDYAANEQSGIISSIEFFCNQYEREDNASNSSEYSLLLYAFRLYTDDRSVLRDQDKVLFSRSSIDISDDAYSALQEDTAVYEQHSENKKLLIVKNSIHINENVYQIYTINDVSKIYSTADHMAFRYLGICLLSLIIGSALIIVIVRRNVKPLETLSAATKRIIKGHYSDRVVVDGNDEIAVLAADFNEMINSIRQKIDELHEINIRQEMFINNISHEIKTPIASIMLNIEALQNRKLSDEDARRSLERIYSQMQWIETISQKLITLLLAKKTIEKKIEKIEPLVVDVANSMAGLLEEKGLCLVWSCSVTTLEINYDLVKSALLNIVDNAKKASSYGSRIWIHVYDNVIEVADEGIGISQQDLEHITEPFYMVDKSRCSSNNGVGLGLALVKAIMDAHDGTLEIASHTGTGTKVRMRFKESTNQE
ncbi:MAG: HAMP domain-containing sensor histidine kinase [Christensenella sp.]